MKKKLEVATIGYVILSSGMSTEFYRDVSNTLIMFFISFVYVFLGKKKIDNNYIIACLIWFFYIILSFFKYQSETYFWFFSYFVNFTIAYALISKFGTSFFVKAEKIIFFFVIVSLIFYTWQTIEFTSILSLWEKIDLSGNLFKIEDLFYHHSLFYTILQFRYFDDIFPRNAGFCWEPGPFSCFIVMAIFFLIIKNEFNLKKIRVRLFIYLLAIVTTQSTTGILALLVMLFWVFGNNIKLRKFNFIISPILLLTGVIIFTSVPILGDKIYNQFNSDLWVTTLDASEDKYSVSLDRFNSIRITLLEFYENPILGIGANENARWAAQKGIKVSPTSGIGNFLARYGLFGIICFLLLLFQSSKRFAEIYSYKGLWFLSILIIIFGFSFNIIETPFFLYIIMFSFFYKEESSYVQNMNKKK